MRKNRIPPHSAALEPGHLLAAARRHFPCLQGRNGVCYVAPEYAVAAQALGDLSAVQTLGRAAPPSRSRARNRIVPLQGHRQSLHLRPQRHGGALAWLWRDYVGSPNRSLRELEILRHLRLRGAPVPIPVLTAAKQRGGLWRVSLGTAHEEGTTDLETLLRHNPSPEWIRQTARAVALAVRCLHDHGARHGDLHAGNILIQNETLGDPTDQGFAVTLVDLDRAHLSKAIGAHDRMRDLMRLYRSLVKHGLFDRVASRGLAVFVRAYAGDDRFLRRQLRSALPRERRRLGMHRLAWRFTGQGTPTG